MEKNLTAITVFLLLFAFQPGFSQENDSTATAQKKDYAITIGQSVYISKLWPQPYRYKNRDYKTLSIEVTIDKLARQNLEFDFDLFYLTDEEQKWRIRPVAMYHTQADQKIYLPLTADNRNYNSFENYPLEDYKDIEAETYEAKSLSLKKGKKKQATIKALPKEKIKSGKVTYYLDFPVVSGFKYGKVYYKGKPKGFVARK